ncbi:MAG: tetraacyldisaccharide 4'-kinase [bacterium]|nr:tetraacyldisaccharide 4'-kinase [bacterium]
MFFKVLSIYLIPFSLCYLAVIYLKRCFVRIRRLEVPVISVGNITAGGTGKTSLVMYIADFYQRYRKHIVVASSGNKKGQINSSMEDEAIMLKQNIPGITITGKKIEEIYKELSGNKKDIVILDDGFHCHHIYKDMDILVIDATNPFDNNFLIPAGLLREPKRELKRADVFIISHSSMVDTMRCKNLIRYLKRYRKPVFTMDYKIDSIQNNINGHLPLSSLKGKVLLAFTGTGNPFSFFSLLSTVSPLKIYGVIYPDHFHYQTQDIKELEDTFLKKGAEYLITTEKDYVKLSEYRWKVPVFFLKIKPILNNREEFDILLYNTVE